MNVSLNRISLGFTRLNSVFSLHFDLSIYSVLYFYIGRYKKTNADHRSNYNCLFKLIGPKDSFFFKFQQINEFSETH